MASTQLVSDSPLGISPSASPFDDDAWEHLLNHIEEKRVIPIIGPKLLRVQTDTGPRLLYDWLAEKLAARLSVDPRSLPQSYTLSDVVCSFLAARPFRCSSRKPIEPGHSAGRAEFATTNDAFVSRNSASSKSGSTD